MRYLRAPKGRVRWLAEEEEAEVRAAISQDCWERVQFAIQTGVRRQEQARIEWEDIQGAMLWVRPGKTGKGRWVALSPLAQALLRARRHLPRPYPLTPAGLSAAFNRAMKRIRKADMSWHSLRHSTCTRLIRAGANLRAVQRQLGHSSLAITEVYAHVLSRDGRDGPSAPGPPGCPG